MREYGGDIYFVCIEAQTLAKKRSSFKIFFITQLGHTHCLSTIAFLPDICLWWSSMYSDDSITIMYLTAELKKTDIWRIRVRPVRLLSLEVFNFHLLLATLSYSKFEIIQLLWEESAPKSNVIRNMGVGRIFNRGRPLSDFSRSSHKIFPRGHTKVAKYSFSFSKLLFLLKM